MEGLSVCRRLVASSADHGRRLVIREADAAIRRFLPSLRCNACPVLCLAVPVPWMNLPD